MLSVRCASQFVGDLGQRRTHIGLCNLNLAQISRKCGNAVYRDRWLEAFFNHALMFISMTAFLAGGGKESLQPGMGQVDPAGALRLYAVAV